MTKKYKIVFDREGCIGAYACISVAAKFWQDSQDGKVNLIGSTTNENGEQELLIEAEDLEMAKDSAEVCPVLVIKIYDVETGEKIHPK